MMMRLFSAGSNSSIASRFFHLLERFYAGVDQAYGVVAVKNYRARLLGEDFRQPFRFVGHPARLRHTANHAPLVVRDGELVQGAHGAAYQKHYVAGAHQHHVSPLETEARVDDNVAGISRKMKAFDMLA